MFKIAKKNQPSVQVFEGVIRTTLACGKDVLMARFEYQKGSKVPPHKHSYEQVTTIIKGEQKIIINRSGEKQEWIIKSGDSYIVPAGYEHEQFSLKESVTVDAWSLSP